jgi:hypothetical protein
MFGDADLLTNPQGEGFCEITVSATQLGAPEIVADTSVSIPPLTAQIFNGTLGVLDVGHVPGFQLVANSIVLGLPELIYDVTFTQISYNGANQYIAPFGFTAPTDTTPVDLADPNLVKLPYQPPSSTDWIPPMNVGKPLRLVGNWRQRALYRSVG